MSDLGGSERLIHTRLEQILHDWRAVPAISASILALLDWNSDFLK
jgi:hypothetical protein